MNKIFKLIKDLRSDYIESDSEIKRLKKTCFKIVFKNILTYFWSIITAPLIYPIWYVFRKQITNYDGESKIVRWIWTYGDLHDPLGWGGMPHDYRSGKNNFINRYWFSAIRNPRFTYNFTEYNSGIIIDECTIIDTRDFDTMHQSDGVGDSPDGVIFKWFIDYDGELWFIYENITKDSLLWFGWVGLLKEPVNKAGRFEIAYRIQKK